MRGNRGTFKIGEIDGTPSARIDALAADIADAEATTQVMGFVWGKEAYGAMVFATAVSDLAIHEVFDDPAYHPLLLAVAREVIGQAPVRPLPLDGFDPDDLTGSLARLADFNRRSAKSHSGIYRDLMVRRRKTETEAILGPLRGFLIRRIAELIAAIEAGRGPAAGRTWTCSPPTSGSTAWDGRSTPSFGGRRAAPGRGGSPVRPARRGQGHHRGRAACRPGAAARPPMTRPRPRTRRWWPGSARRARRCSPPRSAWSSPPASPTPGSATPATRAIRPGRRAAHRAVGRAGRRRRLRPGDRHRHRRLDPHPRRLLRRRGLKPTYGLVPVDGVFPLSPSLDHAGTLTATAADSIALLQAIAGPRPGPPPAVVPAFRSSACCRPSSPTRP